MLTLIFLILLFFGTYVVYFLLVAFASRKRKKFVRNGRYNVANYYNNIVVIVYAHNDEKNVVSLLENLNKQKYPKENYKTYIILDNCTDNSSNMVEMVGGANIFRVGDSYTVGKDESISQLLDRLITIKNIDAYAFLNSDRNVNENFLVSINQGLINHDVLAAATVLKGEPTTLKEKILSAYNTYENNILNTSRSILGLSTLINSNCCVIKQNVIEKVQCIDFKDICTEMKYSVMLAKLNYKVSFDPNIVTYLDVKDYKVRKVSFSYRLTLLKNSLSIMFSSGFLFDEFVLSGIQPSIFSLVVFFAFYTFIISNITIEPPYTRFLNSSILCWFVGILTASFFYTLINSKLTFNQMRYLLLYPFYSFGQLTRKLPVVKQIFDFIDNKKNPKSFQHHIIPVVVSAGDKKMNCSIELVEEDGMIRAIFRFKNKKQSTDLYLRVYDAIKNISNMLAEKEYEIIDPETKNVIEKGQFDLCICQNCKYFTSKVDGTINVIKGACSCGSQKETPSEKLVMLWQCCENYAPAREKILRMNLYKK